LASPSGIPDAHDDGSQVFCGAATIARMTNLGQRTVERAIAGLRRKGYLVESGWRNRKRVFEIRPHGGGLGCDGFASCATGLPVMWARSARRVRRTTDRRAFQIGFASGRG
jgi:hypothetical protein